jgi:hypothetical protein
LGEVVGLPGAITRVEIVLNEIGLNQEGDRVSDESLLVYLGT